MKVMPQTKSWSLPSRVVWRGHATSRQAVAMDHDRYRRGGGQET